MRRRTLVTLAGCLATLAVATLGVIVYQWPSTVRVAVARGGADQKLMAAVARGLAAERAPVRFQLVPVADAAAAAQALDAGVADFAVVRTDAALPVTGRTAVLLHRNAAFLVSPGGSPIKTVADLRDHKVAIVGEGAGTSADMRFLELILSRNGVPAHAVTTSVVAQAALADTLRSGQADAVFVVGVEAAAPVADVISIVSQFGKTDPVVTPVTQAQAIAQSSPAFETASVALGALGVGLKPDETIETVASSTRLMAAAALRDGLVGATARAVFAVKPRVGAAMPLALRMQAPSTSKDAALPTHPGAAAYIDGEEVSLFDRFSDYFYLIAMLLSLAGSAIAAVASRLDRSEHSQHQSRIDRLVEILRLARLADTPATLRLLQRETDDILAESVAAGVPAPADARHSHALGLLIDQIHQAIRDRRAELGRPASRVLPFAPARSLRVGETA